MCDIINNSININKNNLLFNKDHIVYIKNFINNDTRLKLLNKINKKEDSYKIRNKNSFFSILGQLDATRNTSKQNIYKQHAVIGGIEIQQQFPDLHYYYHNCFADTVSKIVGKKVYPVNEINTMNNSLIIYENTGDSLRWHTDKSMFNNKKVYTLLVYLYNSSSQNLCYIESDKNKICLFTEENSCVILEHFTLEHAVTPLKQNEKKILWSMTYAEDMNIYNPISYMMNKAKNISYLGFGAFSQLDIFIVILLIILFYIIFYFKYICQNIKILYYPISFI
jgi:hypothetical protein